MRKTVEWWAYGFDSPNRLGWWLRTIWYAANFWPTYGLWALGIDIAEFNEWVPGSTHIWAPAVMVALLGPMWLARGLLVHKVPLPETLFPKRDTPQDRVIRFGRVELDEIDLFTNILCVGSIGSGKTSTVILPGMEQLFRMYSRDIEDPTSRDPRKKLGGFILEAKGQFYEIAIHYLRESGRNPTEDMVVIRPNCRIPVARFRDKKTGCKFYLNALPCSTGCEAGFVVRGLKFSTGEPIREDIFSLPPKAFGLYRPRIKGMEFDVKGRDVRYVGWRESGAQLYRVTYSPKMDEADPFLVDGNRVVVAKPETLVFEDVEYFDNGIHYNLVDNKVGATEAANKLVLVAKMRDGGGGGGDNAFWVNNAKKHIGNCITLMQVTHPDREVTGPDIQRLTSSDDVAKKETDLLEQYKIALEAEVNAIADPSTREMRRREVGVMDDVRQYFTERWKTLDAKTKGIIREEVTNMFNEFVADPYLQETLCSPATFAFEDAIQKGKVFAFVPGAEYETLAKSIGTILKQEFQQVCLSRVAKAHFDKTRFVLILNDECQKFIVSGGQQGGDEYFMSLSRESRVCNFMATQSDAWVVSAIGRDSSDVYLQSFGARIWLQNLDPATNKRASEICGTSKTLKRKSHEKGIGLKGFMGKEGMSVTTDTSYEKDEKFSTEKFINLNKNEAIIFNKGEQSRHDKASKVTLKYSDATGPSGAVKVAECMRRYLRDALERSLWATNRWNAVNHAPNHGITAKPVPPPSPTPWPVDESEEVSSTADGGASLATPPISANGGPHDPGHTVLRQDHHTLDPKTGDDAPVNDAGEADSAPSRDAPSANKKEKGKLPPLTGGNVMKQAEDYKKYYEKATHAFGDSGYVDGLNLVEFAKDLVANAPRQNLSPQEIGNALLVGEMGVHTGNPEISKKSVPEIPVKDSTDILTGEPRDCEQLKLLTELKDKVGSAPGPEITAGNLFDPTS